MRPVDLDGDRRVELARQVRRRFDDQVLVVGVDRAGQQRVGFFVTADDAVRRSQVDLLDDGLGQLLLEVAAKDVGLEEDGDGLDFRRVERSVEMPAEEPGVVRVDLRVSDVSATAGETGEA